MNETLTRQIAYQFLDITSNTIILCAKYSFFIGKKFLDKYTRKRYLRLRNILQAMDECGL